MATCPSCSAENENDTGVCTSCGAALGEGSSDEEGSETEGGTE